MVPAGADSLHYERLGSGYPVVLVGGGSGMDLRQWDAVFPRLAQHSTAIRYDPRGVGRSDNPTESYSDADDLAGLIEQLGYKQAVVIGVSSAGGTALEFALAHPNRATAIIAVAPFVPDFAFDEAMTERLQEFSKAAERGREPFLEAMFNDPHFMPAPLRSEVRALARQNMGENFDRGRGVNQGLARAPIPPMIERLGELRLPVLLLVGERDHPEIIRRNEFLLKEIVGSEERRIADAGHNAPLENPPALVQEVVPFLTGVLPR